MYAPCKLDNGCRVHIQGVLHEEAKSFSIKFINDASNQNISYHFEYDVKQQLIQQSHAWKGEAYYHGHKPANSLDGLNFAYEFALRDDLILVYSKYEDTFSRMFDFNLQHDLRDIQAIEVYSKINLS